MKIPRATKGYWESLGVSIDDLTDSQVRLKSKIYRRLKNKLERQSEHWFRVISKTYGIRASSEVEILEKVNSTSSVEFINLMALAAFADFRINPKIIYDVARSQLGEVYAGRIDDHSIDSNAILLPLFKERPASLKQIFYEYLIQRSELSKYAPVTPLDTPVSLGSLKFEQIDDLLRKYELGRRASLRREIKLWWLDTSQDSARIIFRREKNIRSQLKLVRTNQYFKTGDEKIFIFTNGGNSLSFLSKREPKRTLKIAEYLVYRLSGARRKYERVISQHPIEMLGGFISRLLSNRVRGVTLVSVRVRNAPVYGSPDIEVSSLGSDVTPSIRDLESSHGLPILEHPEDMLGFAIRMGTRIVRVRTEIQGETVTLLLNNRNLREKDKTAVSEFITRQMGGR